MDAVSSERPLLLPLTDRQENKRLSENKVREKNRQSLPIDQTLFENLRGATQTEHRSRRPNGGFV
jgi:hypothetical protein